MKKVIVFVDGNNWYHNVKRYYTPSNVDITKIVDLMDERCDVCLLISGDADFVPALKLVKERGKEVLTSMTPLGYSSELRKNFPFFILKPETLKKCFRDYESKKRKTK